MIKSKLAHAVALAVSGMAISSGASAAVTTMYNLSTGVSGSTVQNTVTNPIVAGVWTSTFTGKTDGWTNGGTTGLGVGTAAAQKWAGTTTGLANDISTANPFNYAGAHMNWGFELAGGHGGTGTISTYDSKARYGVYADIDVAKGAWAATNTGGTFGGWRHDLDSGLFKTDRTGLVTLSVVGLIDTGAKFGFTVFKGMDTVSDYGHHGGWNANNNSQTGAPLTDASNPYFGAGAGGLSYNDIVAYSTGAIVAIPGSTTTNLNTITFNAQAGQLYTIFLGGFRDGGWGATNQGYALTISQVPVPGAVWLFGSAMVGMVGFGRRKSAVAA